MPALGTGQTKRTRYIFEKVRGHPDLATLLEPGVPGEADTGQGGYLLAPEAFRAAARAVGQADIVG